MLSFNVMWSVLLLVISWVVAHLLNGAFLRVLGRCMWVGLKRFIMPNRMSL